MKSVVVLSCVMCIVFISSCKKDCPEPPSVQTLVAQPGPANGQDSYVYQLASNPQAANDNQNPLKELDIMKWTYGGSEGTTRVFIRFDTISTIPTGSTIVSARLYLYGMSSSIQPLGNSFYPGSPYNSYGDNRVLVQRVLSNWTQTTITWNNQPGTTPQNQVLLPESTSQWNYDVNLEVTALVREMLSSPNQNFGFGLRFQYENIYKAMVFGGSEHTDASKRPKLVVEYINLN